MMLRFGSGVDMPRFGSGVDMPRFGSGVDMSRFGSGVDMPRLGCGVDKPRFGSNVGMPQFGSGVDMLLQAAEYVDRSSTEEMMTNLLTDSEVLDDHGYASSSPIPIRSASRKMEPIQRNKQWNGIRNLHNLMEKNRRADMRVIMNQLKNLIPRKGGMDRLTTLQLLQFARSHIKSLEDVERQSELELNKLKTKQKRLTARIRQLHEYSRLKVDGAFIGGRTLSSSETDDVDILSCSLADRGNSVYCRISPTQKNLI